MSKVFKKLAIIFIVISMFATVNAADYVCDGKDGKLRMGSGDGKGTFGWMTKDIVRDTGLVCEYMEIRPDKKDLQPSTGGFMNTDLLVRKRIDIGLVPEDVLELTKRTNPLVVKEIRVLAALHFNTLHTIVLKNGTEVRGKGYLGTKYGASKELVLIKELFDLRNCKAAVYSSAVVTVTFINERLGYNIEIVEVSNKEDGFKKLKDNEVKAFMTTGGWPIPWVDAAGSEYTLATVSDIEIKKMGSPFFPVTLNYQTLGAYNISTFGARNVIACVDYKSPKRVKQLLTFKEDLSAKLLDIQENSESHPSWGDVTDFEGKEVQWPKYNRTISENQANPVIKK